ncbi:ATP-dependent DNA helicase MER3 [Coemansia sp. RSA 552]|nr:ATP-dependent DNA helicase MER3 [Coemansia sp. RSA 552]
MALRRLFGGSSAQSTPVRALYLAPLRALCTEKATEWASRFGTAGLQCTELTGTDDEHGPGDILEKHGSASPFTSQIICATPEKWLSVIRKTGASPALLSSICLVLVDECHSVGTARGAHLEIAVASVLWHNPRARIIAVSATIGNIADVSQWLSAKALVFGDEYRPVPLVKVVIGYDCRSAYYKFQRNLDFRLPGIINTHCPGVPVLVFCSTRSAAQETSRFLARNIAQLHCRPTPIHITSTFTSNLLNETVPLGVAFHHAGLSGADRSRVESLFASKSLQILCSTSTLGIGVNLPAAAVIVKGTKGYSDAGYQEYTHSDVLQFIGRAGRPQFGNEGKAIILTETTQVSSYRALLEMICASGEFDEFHIVYGQKGALNDINRSLCLRYRLSGRVESTQQKMFILIQYALLCMPLPQSKCTQGLSRDMKRGLQRALQPAMCICDLYVDSGDVQGILHSLTLYREISAQCGEDIPAIFQQIEGIGPRLSDMLWKRGITTISQLRDAGTRHIEHVLGRNPPFGTKVCTAAARFPCLDADMQLAWMDADRVVFTISASCNGNSAGSGKHTRTIRFTVLAYTSDGLLLKFDTFESRSASAFYECQVGLCNPTPGSSAILKVAPEQYVAPTTPATHDAASELAGGDPDDPDEIAEMLLADGFEFDMYG